jgi:hypothetical protein
MSRVGRILLVTAGLSAAGAVLGALASVGALTAAIGVMALMGKAEFGLTTEVVSVAGRVGAVFGMVLGPLTAWLALRRVALSRAMLTTTGATILGAIVGTPLPFGSILGAVGGFLVATFWLRRHPSDKRLPPSSRVT